MTAVQRLVDPEDAVRSYKTSVRVGGLYVAHRRTLQSEWPKWCKLYIFNCIQFLTYRFNVVQEIELKVTYIRSSDMLRSVDR